MLITLSGTARLRSRASCRLGRHSWRRQARRSAHSWARREARAGSAGRVRTTPLIGPWPGERRPRARSPTLSCGTGTLENRLSANYAALRTRTLHRSSRLSVKLRARLGLRRRARRWRGINRTRARLWRNHAPLRDDRLTWSGLRWRCCRRRRSSRSGRNWSCRLGCGCWRRGSFRRRRYHHCGLLCLGRWRGYHYSRRRSGLFGFFRSGRSRRWSDNGRRLTRRGHHNRALGSRSRQPGLNLRRRCGRRRSCRWTLRFGRSSRRGLGHRRRAGRRRGRTLQFLLPLSQQLHDVTRLGDLGEVDLRFDFSCCGPFPGGSSGLGGEMLSDLFRFIGLNRA